MDVSEFDGASLNEPLIPKNGRSTLFSGYNGRGLKFKEHLTALLSLRSEYSESDGEYKSPSSKMLRKLESFQEHKLDSSTAIYASPNIPTPIKIVIPLMILMNVTLFMISNISTGAAVEMRVKILDVDFEPISLFNFSLVNTVTDMYSARAYFLAGLVFVWSGLWPYLKLSMLFFCWFAPPMTLSSTSRGNLLIFMDMLGKWCMLDTFLMVMMQVAFHFDLVLPNDEYFALNVSVLNGFGIFTFILGAMMTLVLSHALLVYHKNATNLQSTEETYLSETGKQRRRFCCQCPDGSWFDVGSMTPNRTADKKMSLFKFNGGRRTYFRKASCSKKIRIFLFHSLIAVSLISTLVLILVGANTDTFYFKYSGLAGKMMGLVEPEVVEQSYSMISIAVALTSKVNDDLTTGESRLYQFSEIDLFGVYFVKAVYLGFALVFPVLLVLFLFALWFVPMNLRDQKIVYYVLEIISSWSALDVFILCLVAANMEISQFAYFLLKEECDIIQDITKETCFSIETEFMEGMYILVVAGVFLFITCSVVINYAESCINTRESLALMEVEEMEEFSNDDSLQTA